MASTTIPDAPFPVFTGEAVPPTPDVCRWEVAGGRWRFGGSHKAELDEAELETSTEQASTQHNSRWHASNGRWCYACDDQQEPMLSDGTGEAAMIVKPSQESPFRVPTDEVGTPQGPQSTPGKPLCFLRWESPALPDGEVNEEDLASEVQRGDGTRVTLAAEPICISQFDDEMETLEAVEPMFPGEFQHNACLLGEESELTSSEGHKRTWKKISPASAIPSAARQMSAQAQKAKGHVSEKVHRSFGYVKEHTEGTRRSALKVPAQMSETAQKGLGYVKGQTGNALKVPAQMSETAQKGLGYAKGKALEMARGMRRTQAGGA